ncbi:MAG: Flp pilus assembly complex ATPase component TadA [Candidatus Pacebacteria bacterium]|nr:Flp pilus assembly complex ATPase component TadA [Candidatus Paceibacterota bacterium]
MRSDDQLFGQFLVDAGLLSRSQLSDLRASEAPLSKTLIDLGIMGEDEVRRAQAHALGVPFLVVEPHDIAIEALVLIPEPLARARGVVAFAADESRVMVAVLDLQDLDALRALEQEGHFGGRTLVPHLTTRETVKRALLKYQKHLKEKFGELLSDGRHVAEALIKHALYSRAGGAHVDISVHGALVRYQLGHALHEAMRLPTQVGHALARELKVLAKLMPVARPQTGKFKLEKDGEVVHVHVSTTPTVGGERIHMRLASTASGAQGHTLEALGLHGESLVALRLTLERRRGIVAVSGPTGSGKSTLLYTMLDLLQHQGVSVATVEERVEYRLPHAAQTEVGQGVSVAAALRATLRQHPDILMVGDVRDQETVSLIVAAAARGVFVLAGVDMEAEELLATDAHTLVRTALVRRLATNQFAATRPLARAESDQLEVAADFARVYEALKEEGIIEQDTPWKDVAFAHPTPSTEHQQGYEGYIGVQEVIAPGFETLNIVEDALFKAAQGLTSVEEASRLTQ